VVGDILKKVGFGTPGLGFLAHKVAVSDGHKMSAYGLCPAVRSARCNFHNLLILPFGALHAYIINEPGMFT